MSLFNKSYIFLILIFISGSIGAQNGKVNIENAVDSILYHAINKDLIPGAVISVRQGDMIVCNKALGFASKLDYNNKPLQSPENLTTGHLFDLASLTKVVGTTTSVMLLVDRRLIKLDDLVGKYIPAFRSGEKNRITIQNLLNHTGGLITWYPLYYRADNKQEVYRLIGELPLAYPVGVARHYSDLGFILLGEIIEKVSGMTLDAFERENIFLPLEMFHTTYNPLEKGFTKYAATSHGNPYETRMVYDTSLGFVYKEINPAKWNNWRKYTLKGEVNDGNAWYAMNGISGHAGLFSTIGDLQKFTGMLVNGGAVNGRQFISRETIQLFTTKDQFNNGLGWMMDPGDSFMRDGPDGTFGHTGFTGTSIAIVPSMKLAIILLINRQNMGLLPTGFYYNPNSLRKAVFESVVKGLQ